MTRFAAPALIAAVLTAAAVPATAQTPREVSPRTLRAETLRSVMVCASDIEARRTYQQAYGAPPAFVTAQEALAARQSGRRWAAPRCMTAHQYDRLAGPAVQRASL
ncbi:MAG: hypothetical protein DI624_15310 [Brevundimonas sp.]|jgi:hypothetical protein|uniref:hypothetical protein n=2 Tax=Pseudomonadota TaxID=1224 RepID=UPI000DB4714D|nr:hypothetical protein [Brevundimonas sp.]PZT93907.1 MAG: hypothetical protein DI624_15310 [Brevundimonas sp.]